MSDRDRLDALVRILRDAGSEDRRDGLIDAAQDFLVDGNADEGREDRFRGGFDVHGTVEGRAAKDPLGHNGSIVRDDERMQIVEFLCALDRLLDKCLIDPRRICPALNSGNTRRSRSGREEQRH